MADIVSKNGWVDVLPDGWKIVPIKSIFSFKKGLPITKADLVESGIPVISYGQIHAKSNTGTHLSKELLRYIPESIANENPESRLHENDIVFADTSEDTDGMGNAVLVDTSDPVYAGYHTVTAVPNNGGNTKYFAYLFLSDCWRLQIRSDANGIKVFSITQSMLRNTQVIVPPVSEQNAICAYLDSKCADIDSAISEAKASIEDYKALKQSIITQAVTQGLNPNAEMKDSGIEWIGEVPSDWKIVPFKRVMNERNEKNDPIVSEERLSLSIDKGITLYSEKTTNLDRFKDDFTQYKIAHIGDLVFNSMNMIVGATGVSKYFGCVSPAYYTFYDSTADHITAQYFQYVYTSKTIRPYLKSLGKGIMSIDRGDDKVNTCRLKISRDDLRSMAVPCPSIETQREIVAYLNEKVVQIDELMADKETMIADLESYKKSLIYECVTGKREVPNA